MKRMHLIEIADQPWCPRTLRYGVTDFVRFLTEATGAYNPAAPLLAGALRDAGVRHVLDLGSGAAGPWLRLLPLLRELGVNVTVCLSDCFPDRKAFEQARRLSLQAITYRSEPVDATQVPDGLTGFRTMFSAFHHLRPEQARAVLNDAVAKQEGIAVFECADRHLLSLLLALGTPLRVLLASPFVRPFRWSRLFWTYLVPALPLVLTFDIVVSCLRIYSVAELLELTAGLDCYHWEAGTVRVKGMPVRVTYLIGIPASDSSVDPSESRP